MISSNNLRLMTCDLPCRIICLDDMPYLERYFLHRDEESGIQQWLHHFVLPDSDRYLHTHPWRAESLILSGGYTEVRKYPGLPLTTSIYDVGDRNIILPSTLHRVITIKPQTWTLMAVHPGWTPTWHFINDAGDTIDMQKSHGDPDQWWAQYGNRDYEYHKLQRARKDDGTQ